MAQIGPEKVQASKDTCQETPLKTTWCFWTDKKTADRKETSAYREGLQHLGSCDTMETFHELYVSMQKPGELPRDHNLFLFRDGCKPMWEEFPEGGCWIIRVKRKGSDVSTDVMWEQLVRACVTESFDTLDVVGCVLSSRLKGEVISIWNRSNEDDESRFQIGERLKDILNFNEHTIIQYKEHKESLRDFSTYRNAKNFMFVVSPSASPSGSPVLGPKKGAGKAPLPRMAPVWYPNMPIWPGDGLPFRQEFFGGYEDERFSNIICNPYTFNESSVSQLSADAPEWSPQDHIKLEWSPQDHINAPIWSPDFPGEDSWSMPPAKEPSSLEKKSLLSASAQPFFPANYQGASEPANDVTCPVYDMTLEPWATSIEPGVECDAFHTLAT